MLTFKFLCPLTSLWVWPLGGISRGWAAGREKNRCISSPISSLLWCWFLHWLGLQVLLFPLLHFSLGCCKALGTTPSWYQAGLHELLDTKTFCVPHLTDSEKAMATHSSTLDWKIPWTEKPGRLQATRGREESDTTERLHFHFSLSCIGEGNGNPLQCSYLENPRDGGAWWAAIYGVAQSRTRLKWLSSNSFSLMIGNSLHSASMTFSEFQQADSSVGNQGREGM